MDVLCASKDAGGGRCEVEDWETEMRSQRPLATGGRVVPGESESFVVGSGSDAVGRGEEEVGVGAAWRVEAEEAKENGALEDTVAETAEVGGMELAEEEDLLGHADDAPWRELVESSERDGGAIVG